MKRAAIVKAIAKIITDKFTPKDPIVEQDYLLSLMHCNVQSTDDVKVVTSKIFTELGVQVDGVTANTTFNELVDKVYALLNA